MDYYIPSFEDDPKNRLMDEITFTDTLVSPQKRSRIKTPQSDEDATESREGERRRSAEESTVHPSGPDEF